MIDYKPAGTSITGEYYANVIKQLRVAIKEKRRGKLAAGVLFLHDNALVHKSRVAQAAIRECKFEQLNHPPHSPDLAPSDYYLFRNLKSHLRGTRIQDDDELKAATEAWFEDQIEDFRDIPVVSLFFSLISIFKFRMQTAFQINLLPFSIAFIRRCTKVD